MAADRHHAGLRPRDDHARLVKRVYEAVYAKVLAADCAMQKPRFENLTARTRRFFRLMFPEQSPRRAGAPPTDGGRHADDGAKASATYRRRR